MGDDAQTRTQAPTLQAARPNVVVFVFFLTFLFFLNKVGCQVFLSFLIFVVYAGDKTIERRQWSVATHHH